MLIKIIVLISLSTVASGIDYDEEISSGQKLYYSEQSFLKKTFKLVKEDNDYYEIINIYGKVTIIKGEKEIAKLEGNKEESYYFKYDINSIYYIIFEFPSSTFDLCGFKVSTSKNEFNNKLNSSVKLDNSKNHNPILKGLSNLHQKDYTAYEYLNGLNENNEANIIDKDIFQCLSTIKSYIIKPNSQKKYIFLLSNSTEEVFLEDKTLKELDSDLNFFKIDKDNKLDIYAKSNYKICLELKYQTLSDEFEMKSNQKLTFNLVDANYFIFRLIVKKYKKVTIQINTEKNNIKCDNYYLDNAKYIFKNEITTYPSKEKLILELPIYLKNYKILDKLTISLYQEVDEEEDETNDEKNYEGLIQFATYCAYACFGIILLPIFFIYSFARNDEDSCAGLIEVCGTLSFFPFKKLGAVYLCKRDKIK